eukprot:TRINITY_DN49411_c0_g1_i1.p1 TRINITY_DN49411_c0_g1~~TRINITY_DN49411_c0_g1_i1.p1  ORF type:complete len:612 (+),score=162.79 TRINITY_DN49411_c0_g1_i1:218-2053(+)
MAALDKETREIYKNAGERIKGQFCWTFDWVDEDLPLENKAGDAMDKLVQKTINDTQRRPALLEHLVKAPKEEPPQLAAAPEAGKERVLIFADTGGICSRIMEHAPEGRVGTRKVVQAPPGEHSETDVKDILKAGWDMLVFGCCLDPPRSNGINDIHEHQRDVARLFFYISKALVRDNDCCKRIAVLTRGCFSEDAELHEGVGVGLVTFSCMYGMINSTRLEIPNPFQLIDLEYCIDTPYWQQSTTPYLPQVAAELFRSATFGHNTVRILHKGRYVIRKCQVQQYEKANHQFLLPEKGIIAITGGNGALGMVMGNWLLDQAAKQKVSGIEVKFLSRSTKVNDQNQSAWQSVQKKAARLNIKVEQTRCDFSDRQSCDDFVKDCTPKLVGVIHSAGILQDGMLMGLTWDKFESVWDPKSRAALYLHDALEKFENPLEFFWMFSSTSVNGNMGQTNYSASNSYLDGLCRHRKATGRPALAIQWGAWGEVGMAANLDAASKKRFESGPQPPFLTKDGLAGMERGLTTGLPLVAVCKYNPEGLIPSMELCDNTTSCYTRNFLSEVFPTTGAPTLDRFHLYTMYRLLREGHLGGSKQRLYFDAYIQPVLDDELDSNWW